MLQQAAKLCADILIINCSRLLSALSQPAENFTSLHTLIRMAADPLSIAGLAVGGVSLAVQVLEGAVKGERTTQDGDAMLTQAGFEYFESAENAENEYFGCRTKLAIQYSRLQRWAIRSCLLQESTRPEFESRTKHNRYMIIAILTQLDRKLKDMRRIMLVYEDTIDDSKRNILKEFNIALMESQPSLNDVSEVKAKGDIGVEEILKQDTTPVVSQLTEEELQHFNTVTGNTSGALPAVNTIRGLRHLEKWSKGAIKIAKQPKRCRWAFVDKVRFDDHLGEVRGLVDGLIGSLQQDQMEQVMRDVRDIRLILLATVRSAVGAQALQQIEQPELDGDTLVPSSETISLEHVPASVDAERRFNIFYRKATSFFMAITSQIAQPSYLEAGRLRMDDTVSNSVVHQDILLDSGPAWVEWRPYTSVMSYDEARGRSTSGPSDVVRMRTERLGALLSNPQKPAEFCVPPFAGVLKDAKNRRFGFVYLPPPNMQNEGSFKRESLHERLLQKPATLLQRVEIAQQLCQWLLYLHCVSWLHKNIRSESVLFFSGKEGKASSRAYVTGFGDARSVDSQSISQNFVDLEPAVYTHPDYLSGRTNGFRKTYDMYSLGVLLVELAYWKPARQIMGFASESEEGRNFVLDNILKVRERLLDPSEGHLEHVEASMGLKYANATRICLEGMEAFGLNPDRDQGDQVISGLLQQAFIRMVVDPLHGISV